MRNKRGQVFSFILALITVAMCLLSIGLYLKQQGNVQSALVSPLVVLEVRDDLEVFEMREVELIKKTVRGVEAEFGTKEFGVEFRDNFILALSGDSDMKEFLVSNLTLDGVEIETGIGFDEKAFLENVVYVKDSVYFEGAYMGFSRGKIGKGFDLEAIEVAEVTFPVGFDFEFHRKYLINLNEVKVLD